MKKVLLAVMASVLMMFSVQAKAITGVDDAAIIITISYVWAYGIWGNGRPVDPRAFQLVTQKAKGGNHSFTSTRCEAEQCSK